MVCRNGGWVYITPNRLLIVHNVTERLMTEVERVSLALSHFVCVIGLPF